MKMPEIQKHFTAKTVGLAVAIGLAVSIPVVALQPSSTGATEEPPIVAQVNDHEKRITTLETKTDATDAKVQTNTAAISSIQASSTNPTTTPPATTPTPQPTPTPVVTSEPPKSPRYIVAVEYDIDNGTYRTCKYTLYNTRQNDQQGPVNQPLEKPCYAVGDVLPIGG